MFTRFKSALFNVVGNIDPAPGSAYVDIAAADNRLPLKFPYSRPTFLQFATEDEMLVSADHAVRPIIVPRDVCRLPWKTGYAETINAGKSLRNEDQGSIHVLSLKRIIVQENQVDIGGQGDSPAKPSTTFIKIPDPALQAIYFGLFDGHAGSGAAVMAANSLHNIIHDKLYNILELLLPSNSEYLSNGEIELPTKNNSIVTSMYCSEEITADSLIIGALESAFWEMDHIICQDRLNYTVTGGCTALVALFILGKLYVANAGDSRAILVKNQQVVPMSNDFTPETEKQRIRSLALNQPSLLGCDYTSKEYIRKPGRKDIGKKMLYRDAYMTGWSLKTITIDDLKYPVVYGEGKRSRVLATIGVTRGFGDHDLKAQNGNVNIKPFLSPQPEVRVYDLCSTELNENDVLIMGTDGLWDITTNEKAAEIVEKSLEQFPLEDVGRYRYRYTSAAQDLVMNSRGKLCDKNWRTAEKTAATIDDISVFVIPLLDYQREYMAWKAKYDVFFQNFVEKQKLADKQQQPNSESVSKGPPQIVK